MVCDGLNLKGIPVAELGCRSTKKNIFYAELENGITIITKQPTFSDYPAVRTAIDACSNYTRERYPTQWWKHPQGLCAIPPIVHPHLGEIYFITKLGREVVGLSNHNYWVFTKEIQERDKMYNFPGRIGDKVSVTDFCVIDSCQNRGLGTIQAKMTEYIASYNDVDIMIGDTHATRGMVSIRKRDGWIEWERPKPRIVGDVLVARYKRLS